jgi:hypothetical protein
MGEYAVYNNERVKIGTCEDMLYLRADQRRQVWAQPGNVDPIRDVNEIRFRFPWPDEDHIAPGGFDDPFRRLRVELKAPLGLEHHSVQFRAEQQGYLVSLPCPERPGAGKDASSYNVHRNGFAGATFLVQQRFHEGRLVAVFECVCGLRWRAPDLADAADAITGLLDQADDYERREDVTRAAWLRTVAHRIRDGYGEDDDQ